MTHTSADARPPRRWVRRILLLLALLALGIPAAGYIALTSMDTNGLSAFLTQKVREETGRDLYIKGGMDFSFGLTPAIALNQVALSNPSWAERDALFYAERLEIRFHLLPLLSQELAIQEISATGAKLALEKNARGAASWQFTAKEPAAPTPEAATQEGTSAEAPAFALRLGPIVLRDTEITYADHAAKAPVVLTLPLLEASATGDVHLKAQLALGEFTGDVRVEGATLAEFTHKPILLDASFNGPDGAEASVQGKIKDLATTALLYLRAEIRANSLSAFSSLAGSSLPETPALKLATEINGSFREIEFEKLAATLGGTEASGRARLLLNRAKPFISATLSVPSYRIEASAGSQDTTRTGTASALPANERVLPDIVFPADGLSAIGADIEFTVGEIITPRTQLNSVMGHLILKEGMLQLDPVQFKLGDDAVKGTVAYNTSVTPPSIRLAFDASGASFGTFLQRMDVTQKLEGGRFEGKLSLRGQGASLYAMLPGLDGNVSLVVENAVLKEPRLQGAAELGNLLQGKNRSGDVVLQCAVSTLTIQNGIGTPDPLVADMKHVRLHGEGTIDLPQELLALVFHPQSKTPGLNELAFPIRIKGRFGNPEITPDKTQAAFSAAKMLSGSKKLRALESFLGKSASGNAGTPASGASVTHPCLEPIATQEAPSAGTAPDASDVIDGKKDSVKQDFKAIEKDVRGLRDGLKKLF